MIIQALLLVGGATQSSASKNAEFAVLYREFKAVCDTAIYRENAKAPALAAGWLPTSRSANSDLAKEGTEYYGENWAHWHFEHNFFSKRIADRIYFIHERIGHPDAQDIRFCSLYSPRHLKKPTRVEVVQAVGTQPSFISSDFGGDSYSFQDDSAPHKPTLEVMWLTHQLNPRLRGSMDREAFDRTLGPARPPTLIIQARIWKEETR